MVRGSAWSRSTSGRSPPEAGEGRFGGGNPAQPGTVGGREEIRRAGLAGEERAVVGVIRKGEGVGTTRPGITSPGRGGKGRQPLADVAAEEPGELTSSEGKRRPLPFPLERRCKASAEKAIDRRPAERPHLIAHRLARGRRADEIDVVFGFRQLALHGYEKLVVDPERQARRR